MAAKFPAKSASKTAADTAVPAMPDPNKAIVVGKSQKYEVLDLRFGIDRPDHRCTGTARRHLASAGGRIFARRRAGIRADIKGDLSGISAGARQGAFVERDGHGLTISPTNFHRVLGCS